MDARTGPVFPQQPREPLGKLKLLFVFLCAYQLIVMVSALVLAYNVHSLYSRTLASEEIVNSQRRALSELSALADAAKPNPLDLRNDIDEWEQEASRVSYSARLLQQKGEVLVAEATRSRSTALSECYPDLCGILDNATELQTQITQAAEAATRHEMELAQARLIYADRACSRIITSIANVNETVLRTKEQVLKSQTEQAHRLKMYFIPLGSLGLLLIVPISIYSRKLSHQISEFESRLRGERDLLDDRVEERTAALQAEIEIRSRNESFNRRRNKILEMVAEGRDIHEVMTELIAAMDSFVQPALRAVLLDSTLSGAGAVISEEMDNGLFSEVVETVAMKFDHIPSNGSYFHLPAKGNESGEVGVGPAGILVAPIYAKEQKQGAILLVGAATWTPQLFENDLLVAAARIAGLAFTHSRMQDELVHRAHHDLLTALPNRMICDDRLQQGIVRASRYNRKLAVLWIDLDKFKQVNDQFGHQAGDFLLKTVSSRIKSRIRAADTVARVGGDEFIAVLEEVEGTEAIGAIAESLLAAIAEPVQFHGIELRSTASIGAAIYPTDGSNIDDLKRHADHAMYRAKERGRNTYSVFSHMLSERLERRRKIQHLLRVAVANDGFELYYQPQFTSDGMLVGLEALIRFRGNERAISPAEFIPIAEESGLMVDIGSWVVEDVCRQQMLWRENGLSLVPVAFNVSALQLVRPDFSSMVGSVIEKSGLDPKLLQIEITETAMMRDMEESRRQLLELEKIGVRLSLDDFGTGHSSLNYIHRLPVDTIKIDRSFVQHVCTSGESQAIIKAIVGIARALDLKIVAEGVETQEQLFAVTSMGCDSVQGFLFSKPVDAREATKFLANSPAELQGYRAVFVKKSMQRDDLENELHKLSI